MEAFIQCTQSPFFFNCVKSATLGIVLFYEEAVLLCIDIQTTLELDTGFETGWGVQFSSEK